MNRLQPQVDKFIGVQNYRSCTYELFFSRKRKRFAFHFIEQEENIGVQPREGGTHTRPSSPNNYNLVRRCHLQTAMTLGLA